MNNAGLPGTGLGGLLYIALALWMPVNEVVAAARGHSSRRRWRLVLTQFLLAAAIVAAVVATVVALGWARGLPDRAELALLTPLVLVVLVVVLRVWAALDSGHAADAPHAERAGRGDGGEQVQRGVPAAQPEQYAGRHRRDDLG